MVNDIKKIHAALAAGTPTEIKIGRTIGANHDDGSQARKCKEDSYCNRHTAVITRGHCHQALHFLDNCLGNTSLVHIS